MLGQLCCGSGRHWAILLDCCLRAGPTLLWKRYESDDPAALLSACWTNSAVKAAGVRRSCWPTLLWKRQESGDPAALLSTGRFHQLVYAVGHLSVGKIYYQTTTYRPGLVYWTTLFVDGSEASGGLVARCSHELGRSVWCYGVEASHVPVPRKAEGVSIIPCFPP